MMGITYASKKAIKDAIKVGHAPIGGKLQETSLFGAEYKGDGSYTVVGPDAYTSRKYYATITVKDGAIVKVS